MLADIRAVSADPVYAMQMNFYSDSSCSRYSSEIKIDAQLLGSCVEYDLPSANSFNIANCYLGKQFTGCHCMFYSGTKCNGIEVTAGIMSDGKSIGNIKKDVSGFSIGTCANKKDINGELKSFKCVAGFYVY